MSAYDIKWVGYRDTDSERFIWGWFINHPKLQLKSKKAYTFWISSGKKWQTMQMKSHPYNPNRMKSLQSNQEKKFTKMTTEEFSLVLPNAMERIHETFVAHILSETQ